MQCDARNTTQPEAKRGDNTEAGNGGVKLKLVAKVGVHRAKRGKYLYALIRIPVELVRQAGIEPGDDVLIEVGEGVIVIRRSEELLSSRRVRALLA